MQEHRKYVKHVCIMYHISPCTCHNYMQPPYQPAECGLGNKARIHHHGNGPGKVHQVPNPEAMPLIWTGVIGLPARVPCSGDAGTGLVVACQPRLQALGSGLVTCLPACLPAQMSTNALRLDWSNGTCLPGSTVVVSGEEVQRNGRRRSQHVQHRYRLYGSAKHEGSNTLAACKRCFPLH